MLIPALPGFKHNYPVFFNFSCHQSLLRVPSPGAPVSLKCYFFSFINNRPGNPPIRGMKKGESSQIRPQYFIITAFYVFFCVISRSSARSIAFSRVFYALWLPAFRALRLLGGFCLPRTPDSEHRKDCCHYNSHNDPYPPGDIAYYAVVIPAVPKRDALI